MIWSFVRALVSRGPRIEAGATAAQRADTFWSTRGPGLDPVVSNNTNELNTYSPGRFRLEVSTLDWPMRARILGHEHAGPALTLLVVAIAGWIQRDQQQAAIVCVFGHGRASRLL